MAPPANPQEIIREGVVTMISKSYCPFCDKSKQTLTKQGIPFKAYEVDADNWPADVIEEYHTLAKMRTFPKNFIGTVCIGGNSELNSAIQSGQLQKLLEQQNIQKQ